MNISFLIFSATFLHSSICIFQRIDSNLCHSFQVWRSDLIHFGGRILFHGKDICCIYLSNTGVRVWKRNPVYKYQKLAKSTISCLYFNTSINISTFNKYQTSNQQISTKLIVKNQQYRFSPSILTAPKQPKTAHKDPGRNFMAPNDRIGLGYIIFVLVCYNVSYVIKFNCI